MIMFYIDFICFFNQFLGVDSIGDSIAHFDCIHIWEELDRPEIEKREVEEAKCFGRI